MHQSLIISSGVDYLTASTDIPADREKLQRVASAEMFKEQLRGNEIHPCSFEGYSGLACGSASAGVREGRIVVRLSGHIAQERWKDVVEHAANVSRLDLQVTARYAPALPYLAEKHERDALEFKRAGDSRRAVKLIREDVSGTTLYLGKRVSDIFMRCYDKGRESQHEAYKDSWRYEVELKRARALHEARELCMSDDPVTDAIIKVDSYFGRAGVRRTYATTKRLSVMTRLLPDADATRTLRFVRQQCRRSAQTLVAQGKLEELLEALGIEKLVTINKGKPRKDG